MPFEIWFFITAIVFTGVGMIISYKSVATTVAESTLLVLISEGYIRYKVKPDGTYQILKLKENAEE